VTHPGILTLDASLDVVQHFVDYYAIVKMAL